MSHRSISRLVMLSAGVLMAFLVAVSADPARADKPVVVVSIKPVHSLVASVMAGVGEPILLLDGTSSPHTYSLTPSDAQALQSAAAVFWVGPGLESFLVKPLDSLSKNARVTELSETDGLALHDYREGGRFDAHGHGHDDHGKEAKHDDHDDHGHGKETKHDDHGHGHDHGDVDMHVWLDPANAKVMVRRIAEDLSVVMPADAAMLRKNAAAAIERLDALAAEIGDRVGPLHDRPYVVFHDAYQYFEKRFDLTPVAAITIDPEVRPGARRVAEIRDVLEDTGAACVFAEPQFDPRIVGVVLEGTGARAGELDPLGVGLQAGPGMYEALIRGMASSFEACLG